MTLSDRDYWTVQAMDKYGGSFVRALAELSRRADNENLRTIKFVWRNYWLDYEEIGEQMERAAK